MKLVDTVKEFNEILNNHINSINKVKYRLKCLCEAQITVLTNMKEIIRRKY